MSLSVLVAAVLAAPTQFHELRIDSEPRGAVVAVDKRPRGVTPLTIRLPPGSHLVDLSLAGYTTTRREVSVARRDTLMFVLTESHRLVVTSEPAGATVRVDGRVVGTTPLTTTVEGSEHWLELALDGFLAQEGPLFAPATVHTRLEAKTARLRVDGATALTATVDRGEPRVVPFEMEISPGRHVVRYAEEEVVIDVGATTVVLPPSARQTATTAPSQPTQAVEQQCVAVTALRVESVDVNGEPVAATVLLDGDVLGPTPLDRVVRTDARELEIRRGRDDIETRTLALKEQQAELVVRRDGGNRRFSAVSFVGDVSVFDAPLRDGVTPESAVRLGGGMRYDRFGTVVHGSVTVGVNSLYAHITRTLFATSGSDQVWPVLPSLDLFLGAHLRFGSPAHEGLLGVDIGTWNWMHPAVRVLLGVKLGVVLLQLTADARYLWPLGLAELPGFIRIDGIPEVPLAFGATGTAGLTW